VEFNRIFKIIFLISLIGFLGFVIDFGFLLSPQNQEFLSKYFFFALVVGITSTVLKYFTKSKVLKFNVIAFDAAHIALILLVLYYYFHLEMSSEGAKHWHSSFFVQLAVVWMFVREYSYLKINFKRTFLNPAQLFILSFLFIIITGSLLLMLPNCTHHGISFLNALFTSASAVCVTGLAVVDTGTYFTQFGQYVIMMLIQIGGLGILTFASYFSYFFKGGSSYENQLVLGEMNNADKIGEVFSIIKNIILITFIIELIGAIMIFISINQVHFNTLHDKIFFSAFHSVSAFCNAGFSTLTNSMYETGFRYNYFLHTNIILLLVLGGLGFPIVVNMLNYFKYKFLRLFHHSAKRNKHRTWVINLNSRITLITTISLTVIATALFFGIEYKNVLVEHHGIGKIVTAVFLAASPRTAGFNSVDMASLHISTIMITCLLMWIGASPASTGGGIKTSTFAIAILNFMSLAKGKSRIEIYRREIADISVRRAFAVIFLSLFVIGLGILVISISDSEKNLLSIAFECFSAYGTVGLSLGITASLSAVGKFVIIMIMFIGRVSMLSIMIAIINKVKHKNYRYPTEEILIN